MSLILHFFFCFNDTATTEIYTLSLHDALPISSCNGREYGSAHQPDRKHQVPGRPYQAVHAGVAGRSERKSTRLNSSHTVISYAVFCLKKKKKKKNKINRHIVNNINHKYSQQVS